MLKRTFSIFSNINRSASKASFSTPKSNSFSSFVSKSTISSNKINSTFASSKNSFHTTSIKKGSGWRDGDFKQIEEVEWPTNTFKDYKTEDVEGTKAFSYFMVGAAASTYASAIKNGVWITLSQLSPTADVLAVANVEVDLSTIPEGTTATIKWRGKPLFVRHRTAEEINVENAVALSDLRDPQTDADRNKRQEFAIVVGVCTHLGCIPLANQGDFKGWYCPCHGSHYDTSGRIRKGPAPRNLDVPPMTYVSDTTVLVGQ